MVGIGGVVIPNGAVRMEGTGLQYLPLEFPAVPDFSLVKALEEASLGLGYDSVIIQKDSFYTEIDTEIDPETKPVAYDLIPRWHKGRRWCSWGTRNGRTDDEAGHQPATGL